MFLALITLEFLAKLLVVAIFTPMWLPIVKELWNEVNESLIEDGGLLGKDVDQEEVQRVLRDRSRSGASLVSERTDGLGTRRPAAGGGRRDAKGGKAPAPKRRGF